MSDFVIFLGLAAAMGFSIFLSLPVILIKGMRSRTIVFLNAAAIGILIFLLADIFGDVAPLISGSVTYFTDPTRDLLFGGSVVAIFAALYVIDQRPPALATQGESEAPTAPGIANPARLAAIIALAIGLQNLTEGLFFGANWSSGALGLLTVTFLGFFLQNFTEGFPIVSPYFGQTIRTWGTIAALFLLGGVPTIVGGAIGYFYTNTTLVVVFDALAIGAILYSLLPMLKVALRTEGPRSLSYYRMRLVYFGVLTGFLVGFVVNAF